MTQKERFLALLRGEQPDGFVNQYGYIFILTDYPLSKLEARPRGHSVTAWGIQYEWGENEPGPMPLVDEEHRVCKDIEAWEEYVHAPGLDTDSADWDSARAAVHAVREKNEQLAAVFFRPGTFERFHLLCGFEDALCALLVNPDESKALIDYINDWRMEYIKRTLDELPEVEAVFCHDDWGTKNSTFMSQETFDTFFRPGYEKLYGYTKSRGKLVIHHADSYCAPLVDTMIDMGIDCWQGVLPTNDIPAIQKKLRDEGKHLVLQGGLDSGVFDRDDSTEEEIRQHVAETIAANAAGGHWIPCINDGIPSIIHQQNYDIICDEIAKQEKIYFHKASKNENKE